MQDAIQGYKSGKFRAGSQPNVADHFGMGMGGGMGKGMGRGMGRGMMPGAASAPQPASPEPGLEELKTQSQMLAQQLSEIQRRIEDMEKKGK